MMEKGGGNASLIPKKKVKRRMSNKYAWTWTVKEDCVDEYVRIHANVWPNV